MDLDNSALDREWTTFPDLPGTHLSWRAAQRRTWELVSKTGDLWATVRPPVDADGCRVSVQNMIYVVREVGGHVRRTSKKYPLRQVNAVDSNGISALSWQGGHYRQQADTLLNLKDGRQLKCPVRRTGNRTLMSAVEHRDPELSLIRYRLTRGITWLPPSLSLRQIYSVQIVVSDDGLAIPDLALLVAMTSHLPWFFSLIPGG
jgi:hypothetical protein